MGFKNMKRDDHGHVISNDETDGQKCQHQSGGISQNKYNELKSKSDAKMQQMNDENKKAQEHYNKSMADYRANTEKEQKEMLQKLGLSNEVFDDDYDEEFDAWDREHMTTDKEPDARPNHTKLNDMNLSDSELWNMAYQYIGNDKLEKLAESLDLDSPQDLTTNDMLQAMPDDDIGDMMRINGLDDEFEDESQEEYEARIKPEAEKFKQQMDNAGYKLKDKEYGLEYDKNAAEKFKNAGFDVASEEEVNEVFGKDNLNPNNPKYKGFKRSDITNAKIIDEGKKVHNYDKDEDETLSIIEYVPYGALQDGDNRKLYGVVRNYDGSDTPKIGAIVSPSLESAKEDLQHQIELSEQGSERYLKRGKWDEEWFNMLNDKEYDFSDEDRKKYSDKYGWDFSKPWKEQKHIKGK